jgi:hypothetical protein
MLPAPSDNTIRANTLRLALAGLGIDSDAGVASKHHFGLTAGPAAPESGPRYVRRLGVGLPNQTGDARRKPIQLAARA